MSINYNNKKFKPLFNSKNGEVTDDLIFEYQQNGNMLTCTYSGSKIKSGHLIGLVDEEGKIEMVYHQVNAKGKLMTGKCISTPELLKDGRIRLHEKWQWTNGDQSKGSSILVEV